MTKVSFVASGQNKRHMLAGHAYFWSKRIHREIPFLPLVQRFVRSKRRVVLTFRTLSTVGVVCLSWISGNRSCRGALVSTTSNKYFGGVICCGNGGFTTVVMTIDVHEVNDESTVLV